MDQILPKNSIFECCYSIERSLSSRLSLPNFMQIKQEPQEKQTQVHPCIQLKLEQLFQKNSQVIRPYVSRTSAIQLIYISPICYRGDRKSQCFPYQRIPQQEVGIKKVLKIDCKSGFYFRNPYTLQLNKERTLLVKFTFSEVF